VTPAVPSPRARAVLPESEVVEPVRRTPPAPAPAQARSPGATPAPTSGPVAVGGGAATPAATPERPRTLGQARYFFTLTTSTQQRPVGEMQGGYRVDFDYWRDKGALSCLPGSMLPLEIRPLVESARIVSGSDWAFVSELGIVDFDSRVTARLGGDKPEDQCLLAGRFRGRADLAKARSATGTPIFPDPVDRSTVVNRWKAGLPEKTYIPLVLAVTFEVPLEDFDKSQTNLYDQIRVLGESLLIGSGSAELRGGPYGGVGEIKLDLFSVEPTEGAR